MTARKVVEYISVDQIRPNPANPPSRMEPGHIKTLVKSIRDDGLQYPILVSKMAEADYQVIDGHRRLAVLKADKHEQVPCIVADGNSAHLYAVVNGTSRPLTGRDWALVYVTGGQVPNGVTLNNLRKLSQLIGDDGIRDMVERGLSPGVYQTGRRVAKYVYGGTATEDVLKTIVLWLISRRQTSNCLAVINSNQSLQLIKDAIEADRAVKIA